MSTNNHHAFHALARDSQKSAYSCTNGKFNATPIHPSTPANNAAYYSPGSQRRALVTEKEKMPLCVKVYYGKASQSEIRRFNFRPADPLGRRGIFQNLVERIRSVYNGVNLHDFNLCWRDEDGDYVVFSSDDELRVAMNAIRDNVLKVYIREKEQAHRTPAPHPPQPHPVPQSVLLSPQAVNQSATSMSSHTQKWMNHYTEYMHGHVNNVQPSLPHQPINGAAGEVNDHAEAASPSERAGSSPSHRPPSLEQECEAEIASMLPSLSPAQGMCSKCHGEGRGVWYKCTQCPNLFLCSDCEHKGLHDQHITVRLPQRHSPVPRQRDTATRQSADQKRVHALTPLQFPNTNATTSTVPALAESIQSSSSKQFPRANSAAFSKQTLPKPSVLPDLKRSRRKHTQTLPVLPVERPYESASIPSVALPILFLIWAYAVFSLFSSAISVICYVLKFLF